jgi:hypothetical protein
MSRSSWEDKGEFIDPYRCSLLALELLEFLFVGNALLIHALGLLERTRPPELSMQMLRDYVRGAGRRMTRQ